MKSTVQVYFPDEFTRLVLQHKADLKSGKEISHPINVNDVTIWNDESNIQKETFENFLNSHYTYTAHVSESTLYTITGIVEN